MTNLALASAFNIHFIPGDRHLPEWRVTRDGRTIGDFPASIDQKALLIALAAANPTAPLDEAQEREIADLAKVAQRLEVNFTPGPHPRAQSAFSVVADGNTLLGFFPTDTGVNALKTAFLRCNPDLKPVQCDPALRQAIVTQAAVLRPAAA